MSGRRQSRPSPDAAEDRQSLVGRLRALSLLALVAFLGTFVLIDIGLVTLVQDLALRLMLRWLIVGGVAVVITVALSQRTISTVLDAVRGDHAARGEAEALTNLAETVAAGKSVGETLDAAADAVPRLFGNTPDHQVHCLIALPN